MVRRKPRRKPLGTIWEISDELWRRIEPILLEFWPKKPTGRKVANWRKMLNAIIFRMRSGCQWDQLPERYGPKSTVHDWFQRWAAAGIFERIWAVLVAECDELGGVQWEWQPADAMLGKARFGGEKDGQESHRPRKKGHQKEPGDRWRRWTAGGGDRRGERRWNGGSWQRRSRVSWSSGPSRQRMSRSTCPWIRRTTTQRGKGRRPQPDTPRTSAGSARKRRAATDRRATSRGDGWSSGRSHGCRSAAGSWCGTRRRTSTTSR